MARAHCLTILQHELGHGIARKVVKDGPISALCRRKVASLDVFRGLPGHRAELLVPIANSQRRIIAGAESQQLIDHEFGLAALHLNPL